MPVKAIPLPKSLVSTAYLKPSTSIAPAIPAKPPAMASARK